jgi:hypothetical protein
MLHNVAFILGLAGGRGIWVFLPLCYLIFEHIFSACMCILWFVTWGVDMNFYLVFCCCIFFSVVYSTIIRGYVFSVFLFYCVVDCFSCNFACSYKTDFNYRRIKIYILLFMLFIEISIIKRYAYLVM